MTNIEEEKEIKGGSLCRCVRGDHVGTICKVDHFISPDIVYAKVIKPAVGSCMKKGEHCVVRTGKLKCVSTLSIIEGVSRYL